SDRERCVFRHRAVQRGSRLTAPIAIIPNGVHVPRDTGAAAESLGPVVGFIGTMNYRPNLDGGQWFVREVWPRVRREVPRAAFLVIGRDSDRAAQLLGDAAGVHILGAVPEMAPHLKRLRVVVAPLRIARGMPNKVLELMAMRRPV